jgi:hypothetical protein
MTQQHPITPPQELRDKWLDEAPNTSVYDYLIDSAAQWGADQELEACCALLELSDDNARDFLQSARRPKPPSLKEQALDALAHIATGPNPTAFLECQDTIRRALELLPDNE